MKQFKSNKAFFFFQGTYLKLCDGNRIQMKSMETQKTQELLKGNLFVSTRSPGNDWEK